jgi:formylglycine-generating enzyme required for sulfatase activity
MNKYLKSILSTLTMMMFTSFAALAQEVTIPDPGLNIAVRNALHKSTGPLTQQDMLALTNLDASRHVVRRIDGLETARNLISLNLEINVLTNVTIPNTLTKLVSLDLLGNSLTNCSIPNALTNLATLIVGGNALRNLTLPANLTGLTNLDLEGNELASFNSLANLTNLVELNLGFNLFTNFSLPGSLRKLSTFYFAGNLLTNVVFPPGLSAMTELNVSQNLLTSFTLPAGMTNLVELNLFFNQLTNVTLPADLRSLVELNLSFNQLARLTFPPNLSSLQFLLLRSNRFTSFAVPAELTALFHLDVSGNPQLTDIRLPVTLNNLTTLRLSENRLSNFTLPVGLTNLLGINLSANLLTNIVLPTDLNRLETLDLGGNQLTSITLPSGLTSLTGLFFTGNRMTSLTLPSDMTQLQSLGFLANPLTTLVLPETLTNLNINLGETIASLRNQGISVFTYPLTIQLVRLRRPAGAFQFGIIGPPGVYSIASSTNLTGFNKLSDVTSSLGAIVFTDTTAHLSPLKFYTAFLQSPPANMVFIPANTFPMGSPPTEQDRDPNEGPQTIVTLSRGFWMGKYEVTQGEYLSIMNTNPSAFPGDLSRPVSSVSWPDATNYCARLTERELAAGRIPAGGRYRLPTEAEWECVARAGTSTRFSYGDDPQYLSLTNYAWAPNTVPFELTVHPVGKKLPNPWGLYDMYGNVFEWCQDWLGPLPGGSVTDPEGPSSSPIGWKVMRGGAFDFGGPACRSASRSGNHPALTDSNLGFRVVLVTEP